MVQPHNDNDVNAVNSPNPINIWNQAGEIKAAKKLTPKRKRWGLLEVLNSVIMLVVFTVIITLGFLFAELANVIGAVGVENEDIDKITTDVTTSLATNGPMIFVSSVGMYAIWVFMMWFSTYKRGLKSFAKDFWLKIDWRNDIWMGAVVAGVLHAIAQAVSYTAVGLGFDLTGSDNSSIFFTQNGIWLVLLAFVMVPILGPIAEELFFRGFLLQGLIRHFRRGLVSGPRSSFGASIQRNFSPLFNGYISFRHWCYKHKYSISIVLSSIAFGFMHFQGVNNFGNWFVVGLTGFIGFVFAVIAVRTKRLGISIFGHIFFNSISVAMAFMA